MIVVAFLIMLGGAVGGLYYWGIDPLAKLGLAPAKKAEPVVAVVTPPTYVDFGLLVVPIIRDREVHNQAEMIIRLEVPADKKEEVAAMLPRLQANFLEDMIIFMPLSLREHGPVDVAAVSRRLQATSDRVAGQGLIKDVIVEHAEIK